MDTAKLFQIGRNQAVRLPKAYRFEGDEVFVKRVGDGVLLLPASHQWRNLVESLAEFEPGFQLERQDGPPQERDQSSLGVPDLNERVNPVAAKWSPRRGAGM
jgi:antitoxin VapB